MSTLSLYKTLFDFSGAIIGLMAGAYVGFWISVGALVNTVNGEVEENAFWLYRVSINYIYYNSCISFFLQWSTMGPTYMACVVKD